MVRGSWSRGSDARDHDPELHRTLGSLAAHPSLSQSGYPATQLSLAAAVHVGGCVTDRLGHVTSIGTLVLRIRCSLAGGEEGGREDKLFRLSPSLE